MIIGIFHNRCHSLTPPTLVPVPPGNGLLREQYAPYLLQDRRPLRQIILILAAVR